MVGRPRVVLLDTHALLWADLAPTRLSPRCRRLIEDESVDLLWSAASSWEISIKFGLGRLELPFPSAAAFLRDQVENLRLTPLPVTHKHTFVLGELPHLHRDPFDRMLVAQARAEKVPIVTCDRALHAYDVETIW